MLYFIYCLQLSIYQIFIHSFMKNILILGLLAVGSLCALGVDLSALTSADSFKCLLGEKRSFMIARAYHSYGGIDVNAPKTLANALNAGYTEENIGVYMFPCFSQTHKPESQVSEMIQGLSDSKYSSIWIDMETNSSPNCGWGKDYDANCKFTQDIVNAAKKSGKKVGIYASNYMWNLIMGGSDRCFYLSNLPLWYAHYDGVESFSDFKSFGGWKQPFVKQYKGTTALCNASVDLNFKN